MVPAPTGLFLDIETSLILAGTYTIHDVRSIPYKNVLQDWFMICASWQWTDGKRINTSSLLDDPARFKRKPCDDYLVVKALRDAIEEADFLIGHNIRNFDYKKLMARIIFHRLKPLPKPVFVDTLQEARRIGFTSRKLDDLCAKLDLRRKLVHDPDLNMRLIRAEPSAVKEYVTYNRGDIPPLVDLYETLKPYMQSHPNHNLHRGDGIDCCPRCGSGNFQSRGWACTSVSRFRRCQCQDCGHWFQEGKRVKGAKLRS